MSEVPVDRFWAKVRKTSTCWLWTASTNGAGYGQIWTPMIKGVRGRRLDSHRVSWEIHFGEIPNGSQVLHKCDVKLCVNSSHLYLGDATQNMRDALERGQKLIGSDCSFAKLSAKDVQQIRLLKSEGLTQRELSEMFSVSASTIWRAYSGTAYKNIPFETIR